MDADLMFVWSEAGVGLGVQYALGVANYTSLRKFVGMEDDRASFRRAVATDFRLDVNQEPPQGPANRQELAALVSAWAVGQEMINKEVQIRAESRAHLLTRPISSREDRDEEGSRVYHGQDSQPRDPFTGLPLDEDRRNGIERSSGGITGRGDECG